VPEIRKVASCNCTICTKKGILGVLGTDSDKFRILAGEDALSEYRFHSKIAKHYFCKYCGIHAFQTRRVDPNKWNVNARCLDGIDLGALEVEHFNGLTGHPLDQPRS